MNKEERTILEMKIAKEIKELEKQHEELKILLSKLDQVSLEDGKQILTWIKKRDYGGYYE